MAPFELNREDLEDGLPFRLMQNGFVTKYLLLHVLADSARSLLLFGRLQPVLIRVDDPRHHGPGRAARPRTGLTPARGTS